MAFPFAHFFGHINRKSLRFGALLFLIAAALIAARPVQAQVRFDDDHGLNFARATDIDIDVEDICLLRIAERPAGMPVVSRRSMNRLKALSGNLQAKATAQFDVTYSGFDGEEGQRAREAFQRAVDIWSRHLDSDVVIRIDATFASLGPGVLGSAGPNNLYFFPVDQNDNPTEESSIYGDALLDAIRAEDANPDSSDIVARFSSTANWYYGAGEPPQGTIDFTSVVLHELGHGLGFFGTMSVQNFQGVWPYDVQNVGAPPGIYDRPTEDSAGTHLINTDVYPNPSQKLGGALTSGNVFFNDTTANRGNGGAPPELYAPSTWQQGSSYSHLDEGTYPAGDENALMSPQVAPREVIQDPGAITCGMFEDMGWPLGAGCRGLLQTDIASFEANPQANSVSLEWVTQPDTDKDRVTVELKRFDGTFEPIGEVSLQEGRNDYSFTAADLGLGRYTFRLRLTDDENPQDPSFVLSQEVVIGLTGEEKLQTSIQDEGRTVVLRWRVPEATGAYTYQIQRCIGTPEVCKQDGDFQTVSAVNGTAGQQSYDLSVRVPGPSDYTFRLKMIAPTGGDDVLLSEAEEATIELEGDFALTEAYPNPTRGRLELALTTREEQQVTVEIYDALGRRLKQQSADLQGQRITFIPLDLRQVASGVYLLRVEGAGFTDTRSVVVAH